MNTDFYNNLEVNFEQACNMSEKNFSQEELFEMLKNGNIPQKQIAALKIETLQNFEQAEILINNLTGCDGKIREAVALKINELVNIGFQEFFLNAKSAEIFANATIDINANICRLVIDSVSVLSENQYFMQIYSNKILNFINESFWELDKFIYKDKKYTINKQLFKLYWCLEALKLFYKNLSQNDLLKILERANKESEYTIREKIAQIVINLETDVFKALKQELKNDSNYYVKNVFRS